MDQNVDKEIDELLGRSRRGEKKHHTTINNNINISHPSPTIYIVIALIFAALAVFFSK